MEGTRKYSWPLGESTGHVRADCFAARCLNRIGFVNVQLVDSTEMNAPSRFLSNIYCLSTKRTMRTSAVTKLSILLGGILLAFPCSLLLVSSALFFVGVPISRFHVPLAAAMAAGFGW